MFPCYPFSVYKPSVSVVLYQSLYVDYQVWFFVLFSVFCFNHSVLCYIALFMFTLKSLALGSAASACLCPQSLQLHMTALAPALRTSPRGAWHSCVAQQPASCNHYTSVTSHFHSVVRPVIFLGWCTPETGLQACFCMHRCLCHGVGGHLQHACSLRGLDNTPAALVHQLPRVGGCKSYTLHWPLLRG